MKNKMIIAMLLVIPFVLVSCSKNKEIDQDEQTNNNGQLNEENNENNNLNEKEFTSYFPFTGIGTNETADRRPVSVMINNHPAARPQSGLSKADIVFEILVEGNTTRFLAIFQSEQPEIVGPVRSAREYYFDLAESYDSIYVYHGAADFINDMIINRGVEHLSGSIHDNDGYLFKRESFRKAPHNSYLLFDAVYEVSETKNYDIITNVQSLPFLDGTDFISGDSSKHVKVYYPGKSENDAIEYKYDEQKEIYTRFESGQQTVELNTEYPIELDNIFILETAHEVIDKQGRRAIDLNSGGNAYLFQKGKYQKIEWANENGRIIPYQNGAPVGFIPGKTWINIVPSNPGLESSVEILDEL